MSRENTIEEAIRSIGIGDRRLSKKIKDRFYLARWPTEVVVPFVRYFPIEAPALTTHGGQVDLGQRLYQVESWANSLTEAIEMNDWLIQRFHGWTEDVGNVEIQRVLVLDQGSYEWRDTFEIYMVALTIDVHYGKEITIHDER